ncbi:MAG: glycoside hydrolase family 1 protein [Vicinamibacteria bacterium]
MKWGRVGKGLLALGVAASAAWFGTCAYFSAASPGVAFSREELAERPPAWPSGFLWGTATAAHQVEGGNRNDWSRFEETPGRIAGGERSGLAVDHWNRMAEDVALMAALKANAYRFSIEWSRVEPEEGRWDEAAWGRYGELLRLLSEARVTPMVTLLHFSLPIWMADRGGIAAPDFPDRFARFAGEAARRFGAQVELWCVLNEPNVQMYLGYVTGIWPPGKKSPSEAVEAAAGLLRAHAKGAKAVRGASSRAKVGVAMNLADFQPASRWSLPDWIATRGAASSFDWAFYDSIAAGRVRFDSPGFPKVDEALADLAGSADWFGANYYTRNLVHFSPTEPGLVALREGPREQTDLKWEIYPEGLLTLLRTASARYKLPIYVTENGIADAKGDKRGPYIRSHAHALSRAIGEGIPVRGYFYWSLMDNFEWAEGFAPRFGLYGVDYATLARIPAEGSEAFRDLAPSR